MTFLEAVASGRKFRRATNTKGFYYFYDEGGFLKCSQTKMGDMEPYEVVAITSINKEDILANDWQLESVKRTISKEDLTKVYEEELASRGEKPSLYILCKALGLD